VTWETSGSAIVAALGTTGVDSTWAAACAAQVNAAIETRLNGYVPAALSNAEDELARTALLDGIAAYKDRDAPHGILSIGPDGEVARVGSDIVRWSAPVIARYAIPGIA
jgi:hypothetical protein